ncbi:cysteine-rich receptor-like protein kinase, partial [Trifolium pratense]
MAGKRKLWKDLLEFKSNNAIRDWILGGDFNAISKSGERRGNSGSRSLSERSEFSLFMEAMEVIDIPILGRKFTWFNSDGSAMNRFDRFLLSEGFIHQGDEFHEKVALPKVVTASFFILIPKKDHPQDLFDYRPICLIGSLYKILSKVLANRLKKVLGKLISSYQSAFLPQRQILDGVLVLNEVIDLAKRRKDNCLLVKVDFERAYDTINWGFSEGWLKWMRACIFESSISILVNGRPIEDFKVGRGLHQGDPLSPFLFLIVVGLASMVKKAVDVVRLRGFKVNANLHFQLLQFADDTIIMGE